MHYLGMERTANLLGALSLLVVDAMAQRAADAAGRSGATGAALALLHQEPGLGIAALRRPLALTQSATVRLVDALVADGLAERRPGRDGRSVAVHLTHAGRDAARQVLAERAEVLDTVLAPLSADERERFGALLDRVLLAATRDEEHGAVVCRLCDLEACPLDRCPVELGCAR